MLKIAVIGEYNSESTSHSATNEAIEHSSKLLGVNFQTDWIPTQEINDKLFTNYQAIWVAPGAPHKNLSNTLWAIQYARTNGIPCLGTCGGFQHIIIEYARNVLGYKNAAHAEYDPNSDNLFISPLSCSLYKREMTLTFVPDSRVAKIYGFLHAQEEYYCNFGVNPKFVSLFQKGPLFTSGSDAEGEMRVVEIATHPFFIGTLFVPQIRFSIQNPHPIITNFLTTIINIGDNKN